MIEPLTKAKLKQYGFDKQSIERLTTWKDYECEIINDRGYFFASNKEHKIYSGIEGKQKHLDKSIFPEHNSDAKEKFVTFEELFRYAVLADSITVPESKLGKQFDYKNAESIHNFSFNVWLQNFKGWEYGNETTYIENLTRENWVEYLTHCENEKQKHNEEAEKIKSNWKPKAIPPQQTETKSSNTSNRPIIADFVERLRAEVEMDELFLRAVKVQKEKEGINLPPQKTDQENPQSNTETHTEKYLCEFEDAFNSKADYLKAIEIINSYFKGNEYKITVKIFVKNGNTKRLAFALGEIWRSEKNGTIPFEYLSIYKQLFTIFSKQRLEKEHVFSSPLYKYSITKT